MDSMLNSSLEERNNHIKSLESDIASMRDRLVAAEKERDQMKDTCSELENEFESARKEHEIKLEGND